MFPELMVLFIDMNNQYTPSLVSILAPKPSFHTGPQPSFHIGSQTQFPHWPTNPISTLACKPSFHTSPKSSVSSLAHKPSFHICLQAQFCLVLSLVFS